MSRKGLAAVVRCLPHLRSLLRPSGPPPASLLPATQVRQIAILPWSFSNPFWKHREPPFSTMATMSLRHHLSTSSAPQEEFSAKSPSEGDQILSLRAILLSFAKAPMVPMILGVGGAVPFLALTPPFPFWLPLPDVLAANPIEAQALYGAVILSFLGGPHWGLAMVGINAASPNNKIFNYASNSARYVWSVVPALLAWPALLMTTIPKLQCLICSFGLVLLVDMIFAGHGMIPSWFLALRLLLSGIVILCLSASLLEVLFMQRLVAKKEKDAVQKEKDVRE